MRLVAVEISPQGNAILITGKNAAGKSSVLDAIMAVFCGKKYQPAKPIRDGEDHAEIIVETENYIIKRTFTAAGGGTVTVSNAEGMKANSPQGLLDKIVGEIAFEPMEFFKDSKDVKRQRQQRDTLMKLVGLDFADIDGEIKTMKDQRSTVKTSKDTYELEAGQIPELQEIPDELISMSELTENLTVATEWNEKQAEAKNRLEAAVRGIQTRKDLLISKLDDLEEKKQVIQELEKEAERLEKNIAGENGLQQAAIAEREKLTEALEPLIDVASINQGIEKADYINEQVRNKKQRTELLKKSAEKSREFADLGKQMKGLDAKKAERLAAAKMPIDGLSVNEETILYDNIPLAQVNVSMQLQIAVAISMALNPKLRVILMKGNDLDSASLEAVCKMAEEKDYQVWIEKVADDKKNKTGFIIEDGSVVSPDADGTLFEKDNAEADKVKD